MQRHVDLLGILYILAGGLGLLLGISMLSLTVGAFAVIMRQSGAAGFAAGLTAMAFAVVATVALVWGAASVWVGAALRRHLFWARLPAMGLAVLDLFVLPFGTALGIYGLWVLLHDEGRQLFELIPRSDAQNDAEGQR